IDLTVTISPDPPIPGNNVNFFIYEASYENVFNGSLTASVSQPAYYTINTIDGDFLSKFNKTITVGPLPDKLEGGLILKVTMDNLELSSTIACVSHTFA
ncbi:28186_t:CDS:1, partial [Gigaspora margarita]